MKRWFGSLVLLLILVGALIMGSRIQFGDNMEYYDKLTCNPNEKCPEGTRNIQGVCMTPEVQEFVLKKAKSINKELGDLDCEDLNKFYQEYMKEKDSKSSTNDSSEQGSEQGSEKPSCNGNSQNNKIKQTQEDNEETDKGVDDGIEIKGIEKKLNCKCKYGEWDNKWNNSN